MIGDISIKIKRRKYTLLVNLVLEISDSVIGHGMKE